MAARSILLMVLFFSALSLIAEEVCSIRWNDGDSDIEYQSEDRVGPQAIAVDRENIYLLDNFHSRIIVFDRRGQYLQSISYRAEGCGLAVSAEGDLVVFSPLAKTVTWICGELAGKTARVPSFLPAISEVWKQDDVWWARCGWRVIAIHGRKGETPLPAVFLDTENSLVLRTSTSQTRHYATLSLREEASTAWSVGGIKDGQRCIAIRDAWGLSLFTADMDGNCSSSLRLPASWTTIFRSYAIAPDGILYHMATSAEGIQIHRQRGLYQSVDKLPVSSKISPQLRDFFAVRHATTKETAIPTHIYVFFRHEGKVRQVALQSYLKSVVSAEIYGSWSIEAHRAMAVAARTYAIARTRHPETNPRAMVCTSTHCQAWTANVTWKAEQGVDNTNNVAIYYQGAIIKEALYFAHCNGRTRNSEEKWNYVPYLRSKPCICGHKNYYGHGVGACQHGLQAYSNSGWNYRQILEHYYKDTVVK